MGTIPYLGGFDSLCLQAVVRLGRVRWAGLPVIALIDSPPSVALTMGNLA